MFAGENTLVLPFRTSSEHPGMSPMMLDITYPVRCEINLGNNINEYGLTPCILFKGYDSWKAGTLFLNGKSRNSALHD